MNPETKIQREAKRLRALIPQGTAYKILLRLIVGEKLTVLKASMYLHTTELRHYIAKLKRLRWPIESKWVNRGGVRYKEYYI